MFPVFINRTRVNKGEEKEKLIIQLINQIQNPELQKRIFG